MLEKRTELTWQEPRMRLRLLTTFLAAALLLPVASYAQTGTAKSDSSLYTELPDNTSGAIVPVDVRDVVASKASIFPVTSFAAAGSTQGTATVLTASFCVITSGTGGVEATTGYTEVWNATSAPINVYPPASNAQFEAFGNAIPISVAAGSSVRVAMTSTTQGYVR